MPRCIDPSRRKAAPTVNQSSRLTAPMPRLLFLLCLGSLLTIAASATSSPLADASEHGDSARATALLAAGTDANAPQVDGTTALHWAVYRDDLPLVRRLLAAGANLKAANRYDVTPLSLACTNGNAAVIDLLLTAGAEVNRPLPGGETPLMTAARTGKVDAVQRLIAAGATLDARESGQQTAVMWAAAEGNVAVVEALIAAGADYQTPLKSGFTPFFFAVRNGHGPVVKALLKAGIDVNDTMEVGEGAGKAGRRQAKAGTSALILAIENGHFSLATELLNAGANPNDARSGRAPLHLMPGVRKADRGDGGTPEPVGSGPLTSLEFVRELVAHGADVNVTIVNKPSGGAQVATTGATPFLMACDTADLPLMRLLLELGADPTLANAEGITPLLAAAGLGTRAPFEEAGTEAEALEAVQLLLEHGADVNTVTVNGDTAIHGAAYASFPKVIHLLVAKGAKVEIWNTKNYRGWTPQLIAEGHRYGNFKPDFDTLDAIKKELIAHGITPPPPTPQVLRKGYEGV